MKKKDGSITRVKFIHESVKGSKSFKDFNELHIDLGHPLDIITLAMEKDVGLKLTGTIKICEDCVLEKQKKPALAKWMKHISNQRRKVIQFVRMSIEF